MGYDPKNPKPFLENWTAITSEVGRRYGKGLAGWFFDDGCVYYLLNPDFRRLTAAAKTGNPGRLVCYNPWVLPRMTDFQDYLCGEGYDFLKSWDGLPADGTGIYAAGPHKGLQAHTNFILESDWPHGRLNTEIRPPRYPKDQFIADMQAGIAHGVVPSVNLEIYQDVGIGDASQALMAALKHQSAVPRPYGARERDGGDLIGVSHATRRSHAVSRRNGLCKRHAMKQIGSVDVPGFTCKGVRENIGS